MKRENICNIDHYSVLIPYKDLEKMLQCSNRIEEIERLAKRIEERCACMQHLYSEILEKVAEMERYF